MEAESSGRYGAVGGRRKAASYAEEGSRCRARGCASQCSGRAAQDWREQRPGEKAPPAPVAGWARANRSSREEALGGISRGEDLTALTRLPIATRPQRRARGALFAAVRQFRKEYVLQVIELCGSDRRLAARHLGIGYSSLKAIAGRAPRKPPRKLPPIEPLQIAISEFEKKLILDTMMRLRWDIHRAASALGIGYSTIKAKMNAIRGGPLVYRSSRPRTR